MRLVRARGPAGAAEAGVKIYQRDVAITMSGVAAPDGLWNLAGQFAGCFDNDCQGHTSSIWLRNLPGSRSLR